ncbi:MAG: dynamin family protein [Actinomycetota bacterium]|nr:dynamin family protein [Actinomycetota bacterium]
MTNPTPQASAQTAAQALLGLRRELESSRLGLELPEVDQVRRSRQELIGQIDDYLLPRLSQIDAPLLAVAGGSTGAGKSTIVNSIAGQEVSPAGVLRPTTSAPVLICNPADIDWFRDDRILPGLPRSTGGFGRVAGLDRRPPENAGLKFQSRGLHLVEDGDIPAGLALLDAPDIDSVVVANRELAGQLLAAADLWLFVTTAARYADAVPWDLLRTASDRSTAMAVVLNRVPPEALTVVDEDLHAMLAREGLAVAPVFPIPETDLDDGLIPGALLAPLRLWLDDLAADAGRRAEVVRGTLQGALDSLDGRIEDLASHVERQRNGAEVLGARVDAAYAGARSRIEEALSGGTLLRGEVLSRWQEVVGTGEFMQSIQTRIGVVRDRLRAALTGVPPAAEEVKAALENSVETVVVAGCDRAAEEVVEAWEVTPGGGRLVIAGGRGLDRSSGSLRADVSAEVREWQRDVLALVAAEGASKRAVGRALSLGVNGLGVALMVTVFAHTGGLTGGEIVVAGGTATVGQKLLEALFGDQAVRTLTASARRNLMERVDRLLEAEAARFHGLVEAVAPGPSEAGRLRELGRSIRAVRP